MKLMLTQFPDKMLLEVKLGVLINFKTFPAGMGGWMGVEN